MAISYRNMQAFVCVAESATFAEAAEKLHLTQPALSSAIKKMEEQLGGKLFSRSTRRVSLTPEGETLFPTAKRLLNDWDDAFHDIQNLFAMKQGKLTIASMPSFAESCLPDVLMCFHEMHPNIRLRVLDVVMESTIASVLNGEAEIGFTFEPELKDGLVYHSLFVDDFIAVVYPQHPLAKETEVNLSEVLTHRFVAMNRGSAVRRWTEEAAVGVGALNIVTETGQLGSVGQFIAREMGISVVPNLCRHQMKNKGLVCLPLKGNPLSKSVGLIKHSRGSLSVAADAFWDYCVSVFKERAR